MGSVHVTAQHKGTHFVDFVPQNEAQLEGLPACPGSKDANGNVAPFKKDRINDFEVCVHDHVHYADGNGSYIPDWQRKSIRLHPAFALVDERDATRDPNFDMKFYSTSSSAPATSTTNYRIDYKFKLPNLNYDANKHVGYGLGEIFINCTDVRKVSGSGSPLPTTQAPETTQAPDTTEAPATTAAPETTAPHDNCKPITSAAPET